MSKGSNTMDREVGYNKENVEELRNQLNDIAQETGKKFVEEIDAIVVGVSTLWYSEVAVSYFGEFKKEVAAQEPEVLKVFEEFNGKIRQAGAKWAATTDGEAPNVPALDKISLEIHIDSIKSKNAEGDRFITTGLVEEVFQLVEAARNHMASYIESICNIADGSFAFFGGGQDEAIREATYQLDDRFETILKFLTEGDNSIISKVNEYDSEYMNTASTNNENFSDSAFKDVQ